MYGSLSTYLHGYDRSEFITYALTLTWLFTDRIHGIHTKTITSILLFLIWSFYIIRSYSRYIFQSGHVDVFFFNDANTTECTFLSIKKNSFVCKISQFVNMHVCDDTWIRTTTWHCIKRSKQTQKRTHAWTWYLEATLSLHSFITHSVYVHDSHAGKLPGLSSRYNIQFFLS